MTPRFVAILSIFFVGCLIDREGYDRRRAELTDDDGDGYTDATGDCDDGNPAVLPGAAERCNDFDDDCDGAIDELDPTNDVVWGADADGDGYAPTGASPYPSCELPGTGWASEWGDCDDASAATYPGAAEACDGADNDCDDATDEEPTTDPRSWYQDDDGDGYGAPGAAAVQCLAPAPDWVLEGTDCDDGAAAVYPGADESCNGVDDDCDGSVDDPPVVDTPGWYADVDRDGYGDDARTACVAAEGFVDVPGDCDDTNGTVNPAGTEVCNDGLDNNCDGGPGECVWDQSIYMPDELTISSRYAEALMGYAGVPADLDADGRLEIVVSAGTARPSESGDYLGVVLGYRTPVTADATEAEASWSWWGDRDFCGAGTSIVVADFDGDGFDDLQVGAGNETAGGVNSAGSLFPLLGPLAEGTDALSDAASGRIDGTSESEGVGYHVFLLGDVDGDGLPDYGTSWENTHYDGIYENGLAYVFTSLPTETVGASDFATAIIHGAEANDELGTDGAGVDLDGDGLSDLVLGAQGYDTDLSDGAALVFFGPVTGTMSGDDADVVLYAEGAVQYAGISVDAAGDVNDDGLDDVLVGAPFAGDGAAYLVWGSAGIDTRSLSDADVTFRGSVADAHTGYVVRGLGDLDGDGAEDIFLSDGPNNDASGYVFFGPFDVAGTHRTADADIILTADHEDGVYTNAFTPGDATGDGVSDLVVGSYKHGTETSDGAVFIMEGTGL